MKHTFSPSSLGIPAGRWRIYIVALKRATVKWTSDSELSDLFKELLDKKCQMPGSSSFRAPQQMVNDHCAAIAAAKGMASDGLEYKHLIPAGIRKRLKMFSAAAKEKYGFPPMPDKCCDLMQYPQRSQLAGVLPALTQRTGGWGLIHKTRSLS
eukprot:1840447-Pyramimonas_sp.AAC.1